MASENPIPQIISTLDTAKNVGIFMPAELTLDTLAAGTALQALISKLGGRADLYSSSLHKPALQYLDDQPQINSTLSSSDEFAVKISNAHAQLGELRYESVPDGLTIFLKSKEGQFQADDVSVLPSSVKYDALIILGTSNLEQLGGIYTDNANTFFDTPKINIDINPGNEYFGTTNFVSVTSSSLCEAVLDIAAQIPDSLSNDLVCTNLLAGIIEQTQSFRDPRTTPATLSKAAQLISAGARQQDIIQYLFKTKPFPVLQLWGRALARITTNQEKSLLQAVVTSADLEKTGTSPEVLPEVLHDIVEMVSGYSIIALAAELPEGVRLLIAGLPHMKIEALFVKMNAAPTQIFPLIGKFQFASATLPNKTISEIQSALSEALQ